MSLILAAIVAAGFTQASPRSLPQSVDPFIGTWVLSVEKSRFENQPPPKSVLRTIDYERDGLILVTAHTTSTAGTTSFVHYLFTLDGKEYEEMTRASVGGPANRPPTYVSANKVNDRAINLVFKSGGRVIISHEWTVSDDGKVLTAKRTASNAQGQRTYSVQVFDKQ